jgi:hypothetical protein
LTARFGTVLRDVTRHLRAIVDEEKQRPLVVLAAQRPDLAALCDALLS